ncbi:MAG: T9SS type A sorting domain-containing protein, partial [Candidatus Cloacimonetes bacterium]|nr:T9SS type A sorting domain-containing protein [Candidatus Cloacimonadota bacterium]
MKKVLIFGLAMFLIMCQAAFAEQTRSYNWEDGIGTVLGSYGNAVLENSTEQAYEGTHSLKFTEDPIGGTPQAYIWWVTGLVDGDNIDASFYCYDVTPGAYPSGRIWAHYTSDPEDITSYAGSAGGNSTYSDGTGWSQLPYSWEFDSDGGSRDGFVVEARIYSVEDSNVIYVDFAEITVSSNTATIYNAAGDTPINDYPNFATSFTLYQNYPNPFSTLTTISFNLATNYTNLQEQTQIEIYNIKGRRVKTYQIPNSEPRIPNVVWDGT